MSCEKCKQKMVDDWNSKNAVGCKVLLRRDDGEEIYTTTRHSAQMIGDRAYCFSYATVGPIELDKFRAMKHCIYCNEMIVEPFPFETDTG